jgi:DNA-binding MarR family transcriptional regulator
LAELPTECDIMPKRESIGKWISTIYRRSQIYINKELAQYNLSSSQFLVLLNLDNTDEVHQLTVSHELHLDKATITRAVNKLMKEGYITRKIDPSDKRAYVLKITKKGRNLVPEIRKVLNRTSHIFLTGFSAQEKAVALELLKRMYQNITALDNQ